MKITSRTFQRWMLPIVVLGVSAPAFAREPDAKLEQRLRDASAVYHELMSSPDRAVPEALRRDCQCIAVFPHVIKGAIVFGARHGTGVMSCRHGNDWSPPCFVSLTGGSWGFQFGGESSDLVVFFMSERGARSLMTSSQITLGGKASVAAGPVGRTGEASTDLKLDAEVYTYAKSKGLFAGLSLEGARLSADAGANRRFYERDLTAKQILFEEHPLPASDAARQFRTTLP